MNAESSRNTPTRSSLKRIALYLHPRSGWTIISHAEENRIENGTACHLELSNQTITVAIAHVRIDGTDGAFLTRLERDQWQFDDSGRLDRDARFALIQIAIAGKPRPQDEPFTSEQRQAIIAAIKYSHGELKPGKPAPGTDRHRPTTVDKPVSKSPMTVADYLVAQIDICEKSQNKIAEECGFKRPHMISMMKYGRVRVPIEKVRPLAKALNVDHLELFRRVISEYHPEMMSLINELVEQEIKQRKRTD